VIEKREEMRKPWTHFSFSRTVSTEGENSLGKTEGTFFGLFLWAPVLDIMHYCRIVGKQTCLPVKATAEQAGK
jgi:hypothetical protein